MFRLVVVLFFSVAFAHDPSVDDPSLVVGGKISVWVFAVLGGVVGLVAMGNAWAKLRSGQSAALAMVISVFGLVICVLGIWGLLSINRKPEMQVSLNKTNWGWDVRYGDIRLANRLVLPTGVLNRIAVTTAETYTLSIPEVGIKAQIPANTPTEVWVSLNQAQTALAQDQKLRVEVVSGQQYQQFLQRLTQAKPASSATFNAQCGVCHRVAGTTASGVLAPDLTFMAQKNPLNTPAKIKHYLQSNHPQYQIQDDVQKVADYLATLK